MLQRHPSRARSTFISPCLNQPVKPVHPEPQALEGGGPAAGPGWRCESCRAPLPEQRCQSPLPRRLLRQVGLPGCGQRGDVFSPQTLPSLITRLLNVTPGRWKAPRCDHRHPGPSGAGNTGSSIPGMQTLGVRKKQSSFSFLFLALTPQMCVFRGRGAALSRFCLQALLAVRQTPEISSHHMTPGSGALQNCWFPSPSAKFRVTAQGGRPRNNIRGGTGTARPGLCFPSAPRSPRGRGEKEKQAAGPKTSIEGQSRKLAWPERVKCDNRLSPRSQSCARACQKAQPPRSGSGEAVASSSAAVTPSGGNSLA